MDDPEVRGQLRVELAALGRELDMVLGDRDLSIGIERSLRQRIDAPRPRRLNSPRRRVAAVLLIGLVSVIATPPARAAMRSLFRIGTVTIEPAGTPAPTTHSTTVRPAPSTTTTTTTTATAAAAPDLSRFASLGHRTSLANMRRRMPVLVPTADDLSRPDQVRFDSSNGLHASLLYRWRPGLPEIPHADGAGLVIEEFVGDGRTMVRKYLSDRTVAEPVDVNGNPGVYLSGGTHLVFYEDPSGLDVQAEGRTVGRALIFQHGELTIRIEGNLSRDRMVAIARTL